MPTPWPKPAPRIVKVVFPAAEATGAVRASNSIAAIKEKVRVIGSAAQAPV
jgi:hypothetical protein